MRTAGDQRAALRSDPNRSLAGGGAGVGTRRGGPSSAGGVAGRTQDRGVEGADRGARGGAERGALAGGVGGDVAGGGRGGGKKSTAVAERPGSAAGVEERVVSHLRDYHEHHTERETPSPRGGAAQRDERRFEDNARLMPWRSASNSSIEASVGAKRRTCST